MPEPPHPAWILPQLQAIATRHNWQCECLAYWQHLPVPALIRPRQNAPRIYLSAGIHGDEPAGPLAILELLKENLLSTHAEWRVCPLLNPAALAANQRCSPCGTDLNRDYKQQRSTEAKAHATWLENQPPQDLFLSLHEDDETTGFYLYEINCLRTPSLAPQILKAISNLIPPDPTPIIDQHAVCAKGWIDHAPEPDDPEGWPEAIFMARLGTPLSFTFETPSTAPLTDRILCHRTAVLKTVQLFLANHPHSPP